MAVKLVAMKQNYIRCIHREREKEGGPGKERKGRGRDREKQRERKRERHTQKGTKGGREEDKPT